MFIRSLLLRVGAVAVLTPAMVGLSGCGGGGGGGPSTAVPSATTTTPPPPPPPPPPPSPPVIPSQSSSEYQRNYGLDQIHAIAAYQVGATGAGITVGVVDSGVNHTQADLAANVSAASTDIITTRNAPDGEDNHGTLVAGVIAAGFNGFGTIGVAYNSTILGVRADSVGSCATSTATKNNCLFDDNDLAAGINYAVSHGAKIINLSIGGTGGPDNVTFQNALTSAIRAGVVFVISAGNDSAANPDYPAMFAIDPRFKGAILAVGATDSANALASYSNKAGAAASAFVVAPGDNVYTGCTTTQCYVASGTSFSAPHVAGALALLLQKFPNLSGQQAVAILLQTADSLGDPTIYGAGIIDLSKAIAPIGVMSVPTSTGLVTLGSTTASIAMVSGAFGNAISASSGLQTVGYDSYHRLYGVDLATAFRSPSRASSQPSLRPNAQQASVDMTVRQGVTLNIQTSRSAFSDTPQAVAGFGLWSTQTPESAISTSMTSGNASLFFWRGAGGAATPPALAASRDAFASVARPESAARAAFRLGPVAIAAETGVGQRFTAFVTGPQQPSRYQLVSASLSHGDLETGLSFGHLTEPQGVLGGYLPGGGVTGMAGATTFMTLQGAWRPDWRPLRAIYLSGAVSAGQSRSRGDVVSLADGAVSTSWRLGASTRCWAADCQGFSVDVSQPLRVEHGHFTAWLADMPKHYFDPLSFSKRSIDASADGRQINLSLSYFRLLPGVGRLDLQTTVISEENNSPHSPVNLGLTGHWERPF